MSIIAWLVVGLISGFLASKIVNHRGEGMLLDIVLGVVGAFVGGIVAHLFGVTGVTGFNVWSVLVATGGAVLLLVVKHALTRRTATA